MATDQANDFNKRLSQWVASQGFWFQLRYSLAGSGMRGRAMFHFVRLMFRLGVFVAILCGVAWGLLLKRTDSAGFAESIERGISQRLAGRELALRGVTYSQGHLEIARLAAEGEDGTFFRSLHLLNLRCKMGLLDGLFGEWQSGVVTISRAEIDLRAGSDDEESSARVAGVLFEQAGKFRMNAFEIDQCSISWGYSERTQGGIEGSELKAQRLGSSWRLVFSGGKFRQNWLRDLQIERLVVTCTPAGIHFDEAVFKQGAGRVDCRGVEILAGARPRVKGKVVIRHLQMESVLPEKASEYVEGCFSGEFEVGGSTNSSEGIQFEGLAVLDAGDVVILSDEFPLLEALSVMDYSRNYRRIELKAGSFRVRSSGGGMSVSQVDLRAGDVFTLQGGMSVRLPTQDEIQKAIADSRQREEGAGLAAEGKVIDPDWINAAEEFSLKRAALEAQRERQGVSRADADDLFNRLTFEASMRELELEAAERMSRMLQYEGAFEITIPDDAFERAGELRRLHPPDPALRRIRLQVPIKGGLQELTREQAEALYEAGRRL